MAKRREPTLSMSSKSKKIAVLEFFKKRGITNPEAQGQGEIDLWLQIEPIIIGLLDELKRKNKVKTSFYQEEIDHFKNMLDTINQANLNTIILGDLFDSLPKCTKFLKATSAFGFDEDRIVNLYLQSTVYASILDTELFKALILFHLKDVCPQVSQFNKTIENLVSPETWKKLKQLVDSDFRNALAHGTWTVENKKVILFKDAKLERFEELPLGEFFERVKQQNTLYACSNYVLNEKRKTDFFT